ncbi:MAG: type 4a pilus biogenesis protein PilO [Candidatus Omnitrophica bacterium]|nr:type 4a pilus biogenesis protein PilO [Candidatus Omnitrophota bacterium]
MIKRIFSKFTQRERFLFIGIVCIAVIFAVYLLVLDPLYRNWSELRLESETAKRKLLKNLKLLADKNELEKGYDKYKDYLQREADKEQDVASALKEIEDTAQRAGAKITSIKPKGEKLLKGYKTYNIELIAEGKIDQFLKFMYELEGSKKLFKIERLILSLKSSQSDLLKGTLLIIKVSFQN